VKRALFVDRDGVLDELVRYEQWEAPRRLDDLRMIEGAGAALRRFADAGWLLFIVTNQPNVAKAKAGRAEVEAINEAVVQRLGVPIAKSYICFHQAEDRCECRKPSPFFLREAAREFGVDLGASWMAGDQDSDLLCGRAAGCRVALVEHHGSAHKRGTVEADLEVTSLEELAGVILSADSTLR
jgi:D-glycero-D-manno-heptose 1,7-bisphosphate phosphatase